MMKAIYKSNAGYDEIMCVIASMLSKAFLDYFMTKERLEEFTETLMRLKMVNAERGEDDDDNE